MNKVTLLWDKGMNRPLIAIDNEIDADLERIITEATEKWEEIGQEGDVLRVIEEMLTSEGVRYYQIDWKDLYI